jgi:hypothetical protein
MTAISLSKQKKSMNFILVDKQQRNSLITFFGPMKPNILYLEALDNGQSSA